MNGISGWNSYPYGFSGLPMGDSSRIVSVGKNSQSGNGLQNDFLQSVSSRYGDAATRQKEAQKQQMRDLLRGLQQANEQKDNPYAAGTKDQLADFLKLSGTSEEDEDKEKDKPVQYNDKEVASKIQRAKTSVSAGQAVLSAKRKVLEVKRKIASGSGDPEELQLALTHAKRMEIVAKKKKNHLELEELAQVTRQRDEKADAMEDAASAMRSSLFSLGEEKISRKQDEIFDERQKMIQETVDESGDEEMLQGLNELIAEFGEDALKELEDISEELSGLEVIDPHMSKEDLDDLKRKHRQSENKDMVKADMEYLKGMIRHRLETAGSAGMGSGGGSGISLSAPSMPSVSGAVVMSGADGSTVDVQV